MDRGSTGGSERSKIRPFVAIVLALILAVLAVWAVSLSPYFRINEVVVKGDYFSSQEYLNELLDPNRLGNIFLLSTSQLRRDLERHPWIERAEVDRVFPRTLEVRIFETYPVAALTTGEGYVLLNSEGLAIARTPSFSKYGVPALTCSAPVPVTIGEPVEAEGVPETIELLCRLQLAGLPLEISEVNYSSSEGVTFYCTGGLKVVWGSLQNQEEKLQLLQVISAEEDGLTGISLINLRSGDGPIVKYRLN
ncbi:MAG: FtsQ-type POTRA domain-containing protein [Firmicutes bacterium]|nr:FtsQ-type POTRA domain-containing protein [Bacillota bacterium]